MFATAMKLGFASAHLSITAFPTIDLPDFTLITGKNGSGKTHLLAAINGGHISVDIAPNSNKEIQFYDWSNLVPNNTGNANLSSIYQEREQICNLATAARTNAMPRLKAFADKYFPEGPPKGDLAALLRTSLDDLEELIDDPVERGRADAEIANIIKQIEDQLFNNLAGTPHLFSALKEGQSRFNIAPATLDRGTFESLPVSWTQAGLFQQSFAPIFLGYQRKQNANILRKEAYTIDPELESAGFTQEEFVNVHGQPPWEEVNRIFQNVGEGFRITFPAPFEDIIEFTPQISKISTGVQIQFANLSSGEKVLMSMALCLYYSSDKRLQIQKPKLLLFDEIDASLHPSMARQLMEQIRESLVGEHDVKVIMTTHSPSTVAVAPENSIFVQKSGDSGLKKVSKEQAISVLTSEIPTLSISFDGRRQVFVESELDAKHYDKLFQFIKRDLNTELSLQFIGVGKKDQNNKETGSGCDKVTTIVSKLVETGNRTIFGLIDWDQKNSGTDRVIVLAEDRRYAKENCFLDPLLVGLLLLRVDPDAAYSIGIDKSVVLSVVGTLDQAALQLISNAIQRRLLGFAQGDEIPNQVSTQYWGELSLSTSKKLLTMNGHSLEALVKDKCPKLKRYKNPGELVYEIISLTIRDHPKFLPLDVVDSFNALLAISSDH